MDKGVFFIICFLFKNQDYVYGLLIKIQFLTFFSDKNCAKVNIESMNLNSKMTIYEKPIDDIIVTGEKLKTYSLRSDTDKRVHSYHFYST